ncbi:MAG TPA: D-aminoacyl-tRNA deacylase [Jatrophihabitans sp.]|jgi:D-tyrosyl-tRNA(Tyr) deacylase|uniref:D-aminoacyl-tRNA deacylase n=1 Tax=Jatrophihabitans sp. TaxID=1932789 RepID=UPI002F01A60A
MRAVVQRVSAASVTVGGQVRGEIPAGLLVLVGVTHSDTDSDARWLAGKIAGLRVLRDGGRDEASAASIGAPVLVVSQFTLYADTNSGRRPSWQAAAPAGHAEPLVAAVCEELRALGLPVATGEFGATMAVHSVNDGPLTLLLETPSRR